MKERRKARRANLGRVGLFFSLLGWLSGCVSHVGPSDEMCDPNPCQEAKRTLCVSEGEGQHSCLCDEGLQDNGGACEPSSSCLASTCVHGQCAVAPDAAVCQCETGYAGERCDRCAEGYTENAEKRCVPTVFCQRTPDVSPGQITSSPIENGAEQKTCKSDGTFSIRRICNPGYVERDGRCAPGLNSQYEGTDPEVTKCADDATTLKTAPLKNGKGRADLRYSNKCQTVWGRFTLNTPATSLIAGRAEIVRKAPWALTLKEEIEVGKISSWTVQIDASAPRVVFAQGFYWENGTLIDSIWTPANTE